MVKEVVTRGRGGRQEEPRAGRDILEVGQQASGPEEDNHSISPPLSDFLSLLL